MTLTFTVIGQPRGKGRPKFFRRGNHVGTYTDDKTASYENLVAICARAERMGEPPIEGPVRLTATFTLRRPKTGKRTHPSVKPDLDNLAKTVLDGCNQAGVWRDDAQVVELLVAKRYGEPQAAIEITTLEPEPTQNRARRPL